MELGTSAGDCLVLLGLVEVGRGSAGLGLLEFAGRGPGVEGGGRDGTVGEHGHDIVADFGETAVDEVTLGDPLTFGAARRIRAGRSRRSAGKDSKLAVVERQDDEVDELVEQRAFGGDDHALEPVALFLPDLTGSIVSWVAIARHAPGKSATGSTTLSAPIRLACSSA